MSRGRIETKGRTRKIPSFYNDYVTSLAPKKIITKKPHEHKKKMDDKARLRHSLFVFDPSAAAKRASQLDKKNKEIIDEVGIDNMNPQDYIASPLDNSHFVCVKKVNLLKNMDGRGLFATVDIPNGTCLGLYTGLEYSIAEFEEYLTANPQTDNTYAMKIGAQVIDARVKGNFMRYINFSDGQENVEFVERTVKGKRVVKVFTTKEIKAGQQILVDYNTYDENASKHYYFLNPSDGWQSAYEIYNTNIDHYEHFSVPYNLPVLALKKNEDIYLTPILAAIFENKVLSKEFDMPDSIEITLPALKANKQNQIIDFDGSDSFTPLMLACHLGQPENVTWLIKKGAVIDQQQNHSGNNPLFLALLGYSTADDLKKKDYFRILNTLIKNNANLFIHDRNDRIFLHKAILVLSNHYFSIILNDLAHNQLDKFKKLFNYTDENDDDIVLFCLRNRDLDKFKILLKFYPDYFINEYKNRTSKESFKDAIEDYDDVEIHNLYEFLASGEINISSDLLEDLGLGFESEANSISY